MSIATMAAKTHAMTPEDELIGSLTRERVSLVVRYTGGHKFLEDGFEGARYWLAHMLDTEVPFKEFDRLCAAFNTAGMIEDADLMYWFDTPNTEANRANFTHGADRTITNCVNDLTTLLCTQLGINQGAKA